MDTVKSAKRYFNNLYKIIQLNYSEIYLLLYLSEVADDEALVYTNKAARRKFIEFIERVSKGEITYSDNTVKKSLQTLKQQEFLIPTDELSAMYLNPKYFFNGRNEKRINMIRFIDRMIEERGNTIAPELVKTSSVL